MRHTRGSEHQAAASLRTTSGAARSVRSWSLAGLFTLTIAAGAIVHVTVSAMSEAITFHEVTLAGLLFSGAIVHNEITGFFQRRRKPAEKGPDASFLEVRAAKFWMFPAALLLPFWAAAVMILAECSHAHFRIGGRGHPQLRGWLLYTAAFIAGMAAVADLRGLLQLDLWTARLGIVALGAVLLLIAMQAIFEMAVKAIHMKLATGRPWRRLQFDLGWRAFDLATMSLGGILASLIAARTPWLVVLLIPVLAMLQFVVTTGRVQHATSTDTTTGVLSASAWHIAAERQLRRLLAAGQDTGMLMIDLDEFRKVNERHGSHTGDRVLSNIGTVLMQAIDAAGGVVGRHSGEEFIVLVPTSGPYELRQLALQLIADIARVRTYANPPRATDAVTVTACAGGALSPLEATNLQDLLIAADEALGRAKRRGSGSVDTPVPVPEIELLRRRAFTEPPGPARRSGTR